MTSSVGVTHGFLAGDPPLFASYHAPKKPARNIAYVVCLPLHYDLIQCYRSMRRLAETLADAGFPVMRVHYDGTGESIGSTDRDPARVAAWLASVRRAVDAMRALAGVEGVGLVGLRIGGTFALKTATEVDVARLVLWDPCVGAHYARELEILAASTPQQLQTAGKAETVGHVAGGYFYSDETLKAFAALDLEKMQPKATPEVLLVHRDDRKPTPRLQKHLEAMGATVTAVQPAGHKAMMQLPDKSVVPEAVLEAIRDWAVAHSTVTDVAIEGPKLASEIVRDGLRWRALRFGSANHLFGMLTEPAAGATDPVAVLLMTGGVVPRTSGNGSYVTMAKRLAEKGRAVLRMDVSWIGESGTADGTPGDDREAFPPSIVDDARAGLDRLYALTPAKKAWMLGLCSGAYASFHTMLADERVVGAFLLNPIVFHAKDGNFGSKGTDDAEKELTTVDQVEQMNRYWQVMRDPEKWKKLLTGKANVRYAANVVRARLGTKLGAMKDRALEKVGRAPRGLAGDFDKLLARGQKVNLVFSQGDLGHAGFLAEVEGRLDRLEAKGLVVRVFEGADHNFHEMSTRAQLIDWVTSTITA